MYRRTHLAPALCLALTISIIAHFMGVPVYTAKSREASDDNIRPPFHTHHCARRWPATRQPLRPRQTAADSGTGEGGESTDEASTGRRGSRREHGLGRHAAVDASTRARAARSACSADGSRLRHGRGRREHRRGEHGQHAERNPNRMSNVCVCVYPTAVGRTVPAREVGTSRSMGHSGMAVPM